MAAPNKSILCCSKSDNSLTERLFDSICDGEAVGNIQALLQEGADIDAKDSEGFTPTLLACLEERKDIVDLLIKCGANVNIKCDEGTVLHQASAYGWTDTVQALVQKLPDLDARDSRDETALHRASQSGCLEIIKCLVEEGADTDVKDQDDWTPLITAAIHSQEEVVDFLLDAGVHVDEGEMLYLASENGWTKKVHSFLKRVTDLNYYDIGETALHAASRSGHLEIVKCFVEEGFDINTRQVDGLTPLHMASSRGRLEIVKWLVDRGADINAKGNPGNTALHEASREGYLELVKWLVDNGADINVKQHYMGGTPVLEAAKSYFREVVELLLRYGANVDATNENEQTLLHYASMHGWMEVAQSVIKRNCDLEARDMDGVTALGHACLGLRFNNAQFLLQAGASWNVVDAKGNSPLNYLTMKNPEFKFIKLLIKNGAYLKRVDYEAIVKSSSLEVLKDVNICWQAVVNQFNNHDLPELYKLPVSRILPPIKVMKITSGSEAAKAIEQTVRFEIQTKGHCNILDVRPMALNVISVRSILEYCEKKNIDTQGGLKRPAAFDRSNKSQHSSKKLCV